MSNDLPFNRVTDGQVTNGDLSTPRARASRDHRPHNSPRNLQRGSEKPKIKKVFKKLSRKIENPINKNEQIQFQLINLI